MYPKVFIFVEAHRKVIAVDSRHWPVTNVDELFHLTQGVKGRWHEDCHESINGFKVYKGLDSQVARTYNVSNPTMVDWVESTMEFIGYICPLENEKKSWLKNITTHKFWQKMLRKV